MTDFLNMYREQIKTVSLVGGLVFSNWQAYNLIEKIDKLNLTMTEIVTKTSFSEKERERLEKRIDNLESYIFQKKR